eukprot:3038196-Prymnesium_polylepis.1
MATPTAVRAWQAALNRASVEPWPDVIQTSARRWPDVFQTSARRLPDVCQTLLDAARRPKCPYHVRTTSRH